MSGNGTLGGGRSAHFVQILTALARRKDGMTVAEMGKLVGRDPVRLQGSLSGLRTNGEIVAKGRRGRHAVYVLGKPLGDLRVRDARANELPPSIERTREQEEALQILLRACRIGPSPHREITPQ